MCSAVHIAGHTEPDIACRIHPQDFDLIFIIKIAVIHVFFLRKPKDPRHAAAVNLIRPQFIFLHERNDFFVRIHRIGNV